jgi:ribosomal protein L7Ae-like RNA K-turn-binding protein
MTLWIRSLKQLKQDKVLSYLGLAMRGRNLVSGEFQTEEAVKSGKALLVIVAEDASENTKKLFQDKCSYYEVPVYRYGTKQSLGGAIGKDLRSSLAITDMGLAQAIEKALKL